MVYAPRYHVVNIAVRLRARWHRVVVATKPIAGGRVSRAVRTALVT